MNEEAKQKWFPKNPTHQVISGVVPTLRLICFPGAGSDSSVFTRGVRMKTNTLVDFCLQHRIELLAIHLPGRTFRIHEKCLEKFSALLKLIHEAYMCHTAEDTSTIPVITLGHSMGGLLAYEFSCLLQSLNTPVRQCIISCTIPPNIRKEDRPWRDPDTLSESEFKDDCLSWDCNPKILEPEIWENFGPPLRSDFIALCDHDFYEIPRLLACQDHPSYRLAQFRIDVYFGQNDTHLKIDQWSKAWSDFFDEFVPRSKHPQQVFHVIPRANHAYLYDQGCRQAFFEDVVTLMKSQSGLVPCS